MFSTQQASQETFIRQQQIEIWSHQKSVGPCRNKKYAFDTVILYTKCTDKQISIIIHLELKTDSCQNTAVFCEKWTNEHNLSVEQRKNLSPGQGSNPCPPEHWVGALSTELRELKESKVIHM